jgi:hypothetical protein
VLRHQGPAFLLVGGVLTQVGDGMAITALPLQALGVDGGVPGAARPSPSSRPRPTSWLPPILSQPG